MGLCLHKKGVLLDDIRLSKHLYINHKKAPTSEKNACGLIVFVGPIFMCYCLFIGLNLCCLGSLLAMSPMVGAFDSPL